MNAYLSPILICLFICFVTIIPMLSFVLIVNIKLSNLISLFPVAEIPIKAYTLFMYLFVFYSSYTGYLHGEKIFKTFLILNIFKVRF